ncbi:MAG: hypothetical protein EDX89_07205 [Acidobacteria bacterium]|nr:MAG: hypothetical protein EDX89_07205 [Acidobacteriota bacterium]MCE7958443.1 hypothetical protein [Acidobacteria bacterium ACB2]
MTGNQGSPADGPAQSPADSPEAAVIAAHLDALRSSDVPALRRTVSADLARQVDAPGFEEQLAILSRLAPAEFTVVSVARSGERASVELATDLQEGRFELVLEEGSWRVAGQSWRARPAG